MRRDDPDVRLLDPSPPLPFDAETILAALLPMLTPERTARIETVVNGRIDSVAIVLDGLSDPHNAAAVLRSAEAFGVQNAFIVERHLKAAVSERVSKAADRWINIRRFETATDCIRALRAEKYAIWVANMDGQRSVDELSGSGERVALVFGNERTGPSDDFTRASDVVFSVPMRGFVESLNVSVAAAVSLYASTRGRAGELGQAQRRQLFARYALVGVDGSHAIVEEHVRRSTTGSSR